MGEEYEIVQSCGGFGPRTVIVRNPKRMAVVDVISEGDDPLPLARRICDFLNKRSTPLKIKEQPNEQA